MEEKIVDIVNEMAEFLNMSQLKRLQEVLLKYLSENRIINQKLSRKNSRNDGLK